jgi:hypothetical protein
MIRWKMFTSVTLLVLLPQCVILCALPAGFFCFFPVIFICSWFLPLSCFSPSPVPSNPFVCQILHCIFCKIFRQIVWGSACFRYFTQNTMVQWFQMSFNIVSLNFICRLERISSLHGHAGKGGKEDLHVRLRKKVLWRSHYPLQMWTLYQTSMWIVVWDQVRGLH